MAEQIRAIILDAGGVLHESNTAVTEDLQQELGLNPEQLGEIWAEYIPLLGSGQITEAEFWEKVSLEYGTRAVDEQEDLLGRAFAEHYTPVKGMNRLTDRLWWSAKYKLGMLSNTIEPHARVITQRENMHRFAKEGVAFSYEIGVRKPEPGAFTTVLDRLGIAPEQAIFVDDDAENVAAAQAVGAHALLFVDARTLQTDLEQQFQI